MDQQGLLDYLYRLRNLGTRYGIERMAVLAEALGHPERQVPCVHVAGTNGKGSVCAMLDAVFEAAGYRRGLYTSPHLVYIGERIQINRQPLPPSALFERVEKLKKVGEVIARQDPDLHPSFFEFMTAIAFQSFAEVPVDVGILETGLGGRLDATNIVDPVLSIITSIGLDHTELLGDTIEAIAREKGGIIKPGRPVVLGMLPPAAEAVLRGIAAERSAPVVSVRETWGEDVTSLPVTRLEGSHQRLNAATVTLAVERLRQHFPRLTSSALEQGLSSVQWDARWQVILRPGGEGLVLEATHNAEGAYFLNQQLERWVNQRGRNPVIVCGILGEDRARAILPVVARHAARVILIQPNQPRACSAAQLKGILKDEASLPVSVSSVDELVSAPGRLAQELDGEDVIVTGSIYLIGEIMARYRDTAVTPGLQDLR